MIYVFERREQVQIVADCEDTARSMLPTPPSAYREEWELIDRRAESVSSRLSTEVRP